MFSLSRTEQRRRRPSTPARASHHLGEAAGKPKRRNGRWLIFAGVAAGIRAAISVFQRQYPRMTMGCRAGGVPVGLLEHDPDEPTVRA